MTRVEAGIVDASVDGEYVRFWLWEVYDTGPGIDVRFWLSVDEAKRLVTRVIAGLRRCRRIGRRLLEGRRERVQELIGRWLQLAGGVGGDDPSAG